MTRVVIPFCLIAVLSTIVHADEASAFERWLAQLNDERFVVREKATSELITANHEDALAAVTKVVEYGSPEASARALLVLSMWHRSDETSRKAVMATAERWQGAKDFRTKRHGNQLAAMTAPKTPRPHVPNGIWVGGRAEGVIFLDGAAMAVPLRTR